MLPCLWCGKGMSFNRGCSQLSQGCKRLLLYFLFRRKKNPDTFLMEICSWIEKMCFWLVFAFSQDSRFILSVRRSKRNEELSGILFLQCVLRDSKHLLFFFSRRDRSQFFKFICCQRWKELQKTSRAFQREFHLHFGQDSISQ